MVWWSDEWHCYSSTLSFCSGSILYFFLCPFHLQVEGGTLERERAFLWGNSPSSRLLGVWIKEYFYFDDFLLPIFSLFCRSHLFALSFDLLWFGRLKEALGWLVVAQLHQDLLRKSSFGRESGILHHFWGHLQDLGMSRKWFLLHLFSSCIAHHFLNWKTLV